MWTKVSEKLSKYEVVNSSSSSICNETFLKHQLFEIFTGPIDSANGECEVSFLIIKIIILEGAQTYSYLYDYIKYYERNNSERS